MSKEERYENRQWSDAVRDMKRAYNQFSDFDWKADVGESQKGAVNDVSHGIKDLNDAVTALDNGNVDSAQSHYDKAATSFQKAAVILD